MDPFGFRPPSRRSIERLGDFSSDLEEGIALGETPADRPICGRKVFDEIFETDQDGGVDLAVGGRGGVLRHSDPAVRRLPLAGVLNHPVLDEPEEVPGEVGRCRSLRRVELSREDPTRLDDRDGDDLLEGELPETRRPVPGPC